MAVKAKLKRTPGIEVGRSYEGGMKPSDNPLGVNNLRPGFRKRWVRVDGVNEYKKRAQGWEPVQAGDPESSVLSDTTVMKKGASAGGEVRIGDAVLHVMPEEQYQRRIQENAEKIRRRTGGAVASFVRGIAKATGDPRLAFQDHSTSGSGYRDVEEEQER